MLMLIGPVIFQIAPFSLMDYGHSHEASYAEKAIMGAGPVLEHTGDGAETWAIRARLVPHKFGGLGVLVLLDGLRRLGEPQFMMRGDGRLMGWVVIERINERATYLDKDGVGKIIEVDINVRRAPTPMASKYYSLMSGVLGVA